MSNTAPGNSDPSSSRRESHQSVIATANLQPNTAVPDAGRNRNNSILGKHPRSPSPSSVAASQRGKRKSKSKREIIQENLGFASQEKAPLWQSLMTATMARLKEQGIISKSTASDREKEEMKEFTIQHASFDSCREEMFGLRAPAEVRKQNMASLNAFLVICMSDLRSEARSEAIKAEKHDSTIQSPTNAENSPPSADTTKKKEVARKSNPSSAWPKGILSYHDDVPGKQLKPAEPLASSSTPSQPTLPNPPADATAVCAPARAESSNPKVPATAIHAPPRAKSPNLPAAESSVRSENEQRVASAENEDLITSGTQELDRKKIGGETQMLLGEIVEEFDKLMVKVRRLKIIVERIRLVNDKSKKRNRGGDGDNGNVTGAHKTQKNRTDQTPPN